MHTLPYFDNTQYTYAIADQEMELFSRHEWMNNMKLVLNCTSRTEVLHRTRGEREIVIIGLCVDSRGEMEREDVPDFFLDWRGNITDLYYACGRFAGKYVILYFDGAQGFLWGDATSFLGINYGFGEANAFCVASTDKLVADYFHYKISEYSHAIRYPAPEFNDSHLTKDLILIFPLPGDVTMYDGVKALLPNHYLDISRKQAVRMPLNVALLKDEEAAKAAVLESAVLVKNIVREYRKYRDLICPLTSGYDSRMIFSFVKEQIPDVQCYTFRHRAFTDQTPDVLIPRRICESYHQPYRVWDDEDADEAHIQRVFDVAGDYHSIYSIHMAYKIHSIFPGKTVMNGQISDQIGKCCYIDSVPNLLAGPLFFQAFQHNWGPETRKEEEKYVSEIRCAGEGRYLCDLWAMEIYCGRWNAEIDTLYSLCGTEMLNIYNCRDVIMKWIPIPRKLRKDRWIHKTILRLNDEKLLDFPFNSLQMPKKPRFYQHTWMGCYYRSLLKPLVKQTFRKKEKRTTD